MTTSVPDQSGLHALFCPQSIAVVGVSQRHWGLGRRVLERLHKSGFPGRLFPITRTGEEVDGYPSWTSVRRIPEPVDLVVIAVPRDAVPGVIDDCIAVSVKAVVIITAGLPKRMRQVRRLGHAARKVARRHSPVGPNCKAS